MIPGFIGAPKDIPVSRAVRNELAVGGTVLILAMASLMGTVMTSPAVRPPSLRVFLPPGRALRTSRSSLPAYDRKRWVGHLFAGAPALRNAFLAAELLELVAAVSTDATQRGACCGSPLSGK